MRCARGVVICGSFVLGCSSKTPDATQADVESNETRSAGRAADTASRTDVHRDSGASGSLTDDVPTNGGAPNPTMNGSEGSAATTSTGTRTSTASATSAGDNTRDSHAVDSGVTQDSSSSQQETELSVEHCSPGTRVSVYGGQKPVAIDCRPEKALLLPNVSEAQIDSVLLPEPMRKGEPYALSFSEGGTPNRSIEVWGTTSDCGGAVEALWWGYLGVGTRCAEFVPNADYSHILIVDRFHDKESSIADLNEFTFCGQGSCPQGENGNALESDGPLRPDVGPYSGYNQGPSRALNFIIWPEGSMKLDFDTTPQEGETKPITHGYFRMPPSDPFGDAWYCIGDGSHLTKHDSTYDFHFANITKLGDCTGPFGTASAEVQIGESFATQVTSSFSLLNLQAATGQQSCKDSFCTFTIYESESLSWVDVLTSVDVGTWSQPTLVTASLLRAAWFTQPDYDAPIQMSCAETGTLDFNPAEVTELSLTSMSDFVACPGTPVEPNVFSGSVW